MLPDLCLCPGSRSSSCTSAECYSRAWAAPQWTSTREAANHVPLSIKDQREFPPGLLQGKIQLSTEAAQGSSHWKCAGGTGWRGGAGRGRAVRARLPLPLHIHCVKMRVLQLRRNTAAAQAIVSPALLIATLSFPSE